jgi:hypothetical protein
MAWVNANQEARRKDVNELPVKSVASRSSLPFGYPRQGWKMVKTVVNKWRRWKS